MPEDEAFRIKEDNYMKNELCNLYKTNKFSDCQFFIGDEKINAHKLILALNSPVFERMLYGPLSSDKVDIVDIEVREFKQMLEYIYLHTVAIESIPNAWNLLYVSRKYFLNELYQLCMTYIINNLNLSYLLLSYEYADFFNVKPVIKKCQSDIINFPTEIFLSNYHVKPNTFAKILLLIYPFVSTDYIHEIIGTWATEECEIRNCEETECNKVKLMHEAGISKFVIFNDLFQKSVDNGTVSAVDSRVASVHYLKLRTEYKINALVPFKYDCSFTTQVKTNQTVLVSGVALQTGEARDLCSLKCSIVLTILKEKDKLYETHNALSSCYIKFSNSVILSPDEPYKFIVTYLMNSDIYCGVTTYYMDPILKNKKNGMIFEFCDDLKGSVLKGLSFYLF